MFVTSVCTHPHGIPGSETAFCPSCKQTFHPNSEDYSQINKRQLAIPGIEPLESDTQLLDECLRRALLKHSAGSKKLWQPLLENGATDEQIKLAIGLSFGDYSGSSEPCWWTAKGGKSPKFWCGEYSVTGAGKPTLAGKALIQKVRQLLEISEVKEVKDQNLPKPTVELFPEGFIQPVKQLSQQFDEQFTEQTCLCEIVLSGDRRAEAQKPLEPDSIFPEGSRIRVRSSLIHEDIGRTGTVQQPWDNRLRAENALKVLLEGDKLCRAFKPESLELLFLELSGELSGVQLTEQLIDCGGLAQQLEPLEPKNRGHQDLKAIALHDQLARLEQECDQLTELAADAPATGWIESGMVKRKDFRQTWWRGVERDGKKTTIYIGKEGSPAHKKAIAAQQARRQLKSVLKQISLIKKELGDV